MASKVEAVDVNKQVRLNVFFFSLYFRGLAGSFPQELMDDLTVALHSIYFQLAHGQNFPLQRIRHSGAMLNERIFPSSSQISNTGICIAIS